MTYPLESRTAGNERNSEPGKPFNVVVAYDAPRAAQEALRSVERALAHAGVFGVQKEFWRFDLMDIRAVRDQASASALRANLLVLVARGDVDLSASIKDWLQEWAIQSTKEDSALLSVFHGNKSSAVAHDCNRQFLENAAKESGHNFFSHEIEDFAGLPGWDFETPAWVPLDFSLAPRHDLNPDPQYRDWGLNE